MCSVRTGNSFTRGNSYPTEFSIRTSQPLKNLIMSHHGILMARQGSNRILKNSLKEEYARKRIHNVCSVRTGNSFTRGNSYPTEFSIRTSQPLKNLIMSHHGILMARQGSNRILKNSFLLCIQCIQRRLMRDMHLPN